MTGKEPEGPIDLSPLVIAKELSPEKAEDLLRRAGFAEPARADKGLEAMVPDPALRPLFGKVLRAASPLLAECPDSDVVLTSWLRFVEKAINRSAHFQSLIHQPNLLEYLVVAFSHSQYLAEVLIRNPEYLSWLGYPENLEFSKSRVEVLEDARNSVKNYSDPDTRKDVLRRHKRRQMLRILLRDLLGKTDLEASMAELSYFAEACARIALEDMWSKATSRYGEPIKEDSDKRAEMAILAMGKFGGCELNYSSDIDLIAVYSGAGKTNGPRSISNHEFFHKVTEWTVHYLSGMTGEGRLFRVDMRLRPEGRWGALACSLDSYIHYYESAGGAWEKQALIKARPVAGDAGMGERFLKSVRPFVYPKYLDFESIDEIRRIKGLSEKQVRDEGRADIEVKLGTGGIRDIEWVVQFLQLLNGGKQPELREVNTLRAIDLLREASLLEPEEADFLAAAYRVFRNIEHRLQIHLEQQIHSLPREPDQLAVFARRLGYREKRASGPLDEALRWVPKPPQAEDVAGRFIAEYDAVRNRVRSIYEQFFPPAEKQEEEAERIAHIVTVTGATEEEIREVLGPFRFRDPVQAQRLLSTMARGPKDNPFEARTRVLFGRIASTILRQLARSPDPDAALERLDNIVSAQQTSLGLYEMLEHNPRAVELLVALGSYSDSMSHRVGANPALFEPLLRPRMLDIRHSLSSFSEALDQVLEAAGIRPSDLATGIPSQVYEFRDNQILRIGLRDILGLSEPGSHVAEISDLGELILRLVTFGACVGIPKEEAAEESSKAESGSWVRSAIEDQPPGLAVLGMGKFGGRELNYGSDLDLLFVFDNEAEVPSGADRQEYFNQLASRIVRPITAVTPYGRLHQVDSRLRPEGKRGWLAASFEYLEQYYRSRADTWEHQALVKLRPVAGDPELGGKCVELAHSIIYKTWDEVELRKYIDEMRQKILEQSGKDHPGAIDVKRGAGGMVQIEFLVQTLQLLHGEKHPSVRVSNTLEALEALAKISALSESDFECLREAYSFLRSVEDRLRLLRESSVTCLPKSGAERAQLARRIGIDHPSDLECERELLGQLETRQENIVRIYSKSMGQ